MEQIRYDSLKIIKEDLGIQSQQILMFGFLLLQTSTLRDDRFDGVKKRAGREDPPGVTLHNVTFETYTEQINVQMEREEKGVSEQRLHRLRLSTLENAVQIGAGRQRPSSTLDNV